jgi:hypothetical protein
MMATTTMTTTLAMMKPGDHNELSRSSLITHLMKKQIFIYQLSTLHALASYLSYQLS